MKQITIIDGDNEFSFYDNAEGTIMRQFEGFEYPVTRPVIEDIPARDGALYIANQFGRRRMSWQGDLVHSDVYTLRRQLLLPMNVGQLKTMQFTTYDDLELQCEVAILNIIMPYTGKVHEYMIEVVAPDYRFYSQALHSFNTAVTETLGGMPIKAAIPGPIGGGSSISLTAENIGTIDTSPTFTIHGPGTNFMVQNTTTGERFDLTLTLTASEEVIVDTLNRTVFKGNQNVFGSFDGDWIVLEPGNNNIVFNAQTGKGVNTLLTVDFRDAYLGV